MAKKTGTVAKFFIGLMVLTILAGIGNFFTAPANPSKTGEKAAQKTTKNATPEAPKIEDVAQDAEKANAAPVFATALEGKDAAFAEAVEKRIKARNNNVEPIADFALVQDDMGGRVAAEYVLRKTPMNMNAAKKDAMGVLVIMVEEMMKLGINPGKQNIMISLRLCEKEKGLTGKDVVRSYGRWRYNPANDNAEWLEAGK